MSSPPWPNSGTRFTPVRKVAECVAGATLLPTASPDRVADNWRPLVVGAWLSGDRDRHSLTTSRGRT
jgi:hypothetical protein